MAGFFNLSELKPMPSGNEIDGRYNRHLKIGIDRVIQKIIPPLMEMSNDFYGGRLSVEMVAGEGINQIVPIHLKAERNNVTNRVRAGRNSMGVAIVMCDKESETQMIFHSRIGRNKIELGRVTFTSESHQTEHDGIGIHKEHGVLAILADVNWNPQLFSLAFISDMVSAKWYKHSKSRRTAFNLSLNKMACFSWNGGETPGFGIKPDGIGSKYGDGRDVCGAILCMMEDFGNKIKEIGRDRT